MRGWLAVIAYLSLLHGGPAAAAPEADLWAFWNTSDPESTVTVDHDPWHRLLTRYVAAGQDGINRVGYRRMAAADRTELDAYIDSLAALDPRTLRADAQMAYWINLYNALTVRVVLAHPGKPGIRRMGNGLLSFGPWDDALVTVAGQTLTLNDIEHRILRPVFGDARIHYAVNCASLGCPNLAREAYTPGNLERLLSAGERNYVNHVRGVAFDDRGRLTLSRIYDWYRSDFAATEQALLGYLADRHDMLGARLRGYDGPISYAYDWTLNSEGPR